MTLPPALTNCIAVFRQWKDHDAAELVALFAYENAAETFCEAALNKQPTGAFLVAVNTYTWKLTAYHPQSDCPF